MQGVVGSSPFIHTIKTTCESRWFFRYIHSARGSDSMLRGVCAPPKRRCKGFDTRNFTIYRPARRACGCGGGRACLPRASARPRRQSSVCKQQGTRAVRRYRGRFAFRAFCLRQFAFGGSGTRNDGRTGLPSGRVHGVCRGGALRRRLYPCRSRRNRRNRRKPVFRNASGFGL